MENIKTGKELRKSVLNGVKTLNDVVSITLGARGKNALIYNSNLGLGDPFVTNDGVTVAKNLEIKDRFERAGMVAVRKAAINTNDKVGDGTTTSTVLAYNILKTGIKYIDEHNIKQIGLQRGINKGIEFVKEYLKKTSIPVNNDGEMLNYIATISANNDKELGEIIAKAFKNVGEYGIVQVENSADGKHHIDYINGLQFDRGFVSPYFATNPAKGIAELENPYILISDYIIKDMYDFKVENGTIPLFEEIKSQNRPIVIIVDNIEQIPLQVLLNNKLTGNFKVAVVKAPEFGDRRDDVLEDIAVLTGGTYITKTKGLKLSDITIDDLGQAEKILIDIDYTTIIGGKGNKKDIYDRIQLIKEQEKLEDKEYGKTKVRERLAKMTGGVAVLKLGANSDIELSEIKYRAEDAINAVKSALLGGVLAGGGSALYNFDGKADDIIDKEKNSDEYAGVKVVLEAIKTPLHTILTNAELDTKKVYSELEKIKKLNESEKYFYGVDVNTGKVVNMYEAGILDPTLVTTTALENAGSIAGTLLTTNVMLLPLEEHKDDKLNL